MLLKFFLFAFFNTINLYKKIGGFIFATIDLNIIDYEK